jgi:hypothetical protein
VDNQLVFRKILIAGGIPRSSAYEGKTLLPVAKNEFQLKDADLEMRFPFDAAGQPEGFTLDAGGTKGMIFKRTSGAVQRRVPQCLTGHGESLQF